MVLLYFIFLDIIWSLPMFFLEKKKYSNGYSALIIHTKLRAAFFSNSELWHKSKFCSCALAQKKGLWLMLLLFCGSQWIFLQQKGLWSDSHDRYRVFLDNSEFCRKTCQKPDRLKYFTSCPCLVENLGSSSNEIYSRERATCCVVSWHFRSHQGRRTFFPVVF